MGDRFLSYGEEAAEVRQSVCDRSPARIEDEGESTFSGLISNYISECGNTRNSLPTGTRVIWNIGSSPFP